MNGSVVGNPSADGIPRAAIDEEVIAKCDDATRVIEPNLDLVQLVP